MKKIAISFLTAISFLAACSSTAPTLSTPNNATAQSTSGTVSKHGQLAVNGRHIVSDTGEIVSFAGPSFFWSNTRGSQERFYTAGAVKTFVQDWDAGIVRAAIAAQNRGSILEDFEGNYQRAVTIIDAAIANDVYVVVDWHSHQAEKNVAEAEAFFQRLAETYGDTPNIIYEIYNEPLDTTDWDTVVKPYSERMIKAIRAIDPDNLIVVGSTSWDQDVDVVADNPITGESNIVYSLHFYAASHKAELRKKAQYAIDKGLPLIITEWGSVDYSGDGYVDEASTREWMDFAKANHLSHMNWAVSDKNEAASMFKSGAASDGGWTDKDLSESGALTREIMQGWK